MNIDKQIKHWANIISEGIDLNEVSDVDVDWSKDTMDKNRNSRSDKRVDEIYDVVKDIKNADNGTLYMLINYIIYAAQNMGDKIGMTPMEYFKFYIGDNKVSQGIEKLYNGFDLQKDWTAQDQIEKAKEEAGISDQREIDPDEI